VSDTDDAVLAEIIQLARDQTGAKHITAGSRLYTDLGMTGDDADEFMMAFAAKYDVDLSSMNWLQYFDNESSMADMLEPAMAIAACVLSPSFAARWQAARDAEREITIAHLVEVAREKTWRDPGEAFRRPPKLSALGLILSTITMIAFLAFALIGVIVIYAFLNGQLGEQRVLALVGVAAMSILFPVYSVYAAWRSIGAKLASAEPSGAS
jgi:hypothetical protein